MNKTADISDDRIKKVIQDFIATSPSNTMENKNQDPAWDDALIGFASGIDPIWQQYKEYIGAFHWTPWEVFNQHCPKEQAAPEDLTVISWVLPQREMVRTANRRARKFPAEEWARIRVYGENCNVALRQHVAESLPKWDSPPSPPCWSPTGPLSNHKRIPMRHPGPSDMLPMQPAWELSACAMGSLPKGARPCGPDPWWLKLALPPHPGPIMTIGPTVFSL